MFTRTTLALPLVLASLLVSRATAATIDTRTLVLFGTPDAVTNGALRYDDVTVTGSPGVSVSALGLAAEAAPAGSARYLDFAFDTPVISLMYFVGTVIDREDSTLAGPHVLEAFGMDGHSLGTTSTRNYGLFSVSALFGGTVGPIGSTVGDIGGPPISRFRLTMTSLDDVHVNALLFEPAPLESVPEPATVSIVAVSLLAIGVRWRSRAARTRQHA